MAMTSSGSRSTTEEGAARLHEGGARAAEEAGNQARALAGQARDEITERADEQLDQVASRLHQLGGELRQMAERADSPDAGAAQVVRGIGETVDRIADRMESGGTSGTLDQVRSYARQHPVTFIAGAFAAGALTGRLARNMAAGHQDAAAGHQDAAAGHRDSAAGHQDSAADYQGTGYQGADYQGAGYQDTAAGSPGPAARYPVADTAYGVEAEPPIAPSAGGPAPGGRR